MKNKTFIKRLSAVVLSIAMLLGVMQLNAFADGTVTFPSNSQSGDNNSTLRYYLTDENAGSLTYSYPDGTPTLKLTVDDGWHFKGWETYFNGFEDRPILSDPEVKGTNPVNDEGYYTFYNISSTRPYDGSRFILIATGTGYYGDHKVTAVLEPIVTVNAGDGVTYAVNATGSSTISSNQTSVKYGDNATITYTVDSKYVVTGVSANYGTDYSDNGSTVSVNTIKKPVTITIATRLKQQKVNFNSNGGNGQMAEQTFEYGVSQALSANTFTKDKWAFTGWNTAADGSGTAYAAGQSVSFTPATDGKSITLYAQWEQYPAASSTAPTAKELTYNGSAQALVEAASATGGEVQYALGADGVTAPTGGYTAAVPQATDAGTYYVWYKVVGDDDHVDAAPKCVAATIDKKEIGITWGNAEFIYNGASQVPVATAEKVEDGDRIALTVIGDETEVGNGYSATVTAITGQDKENYKLPADVNCSFSIAYLEADGSMYEIGGAAQQSDDVYWFKGGTEVTVTATEGYKVSDRLGGTYENSVAFAEGDSFTVYVKRTSDGGMSDGIDLSEAIKFDSTVPTLQGIEDGKTYYGDLTVIKTDAQFADIKSVTVDGQPLGFNEGTYGLIPADNAEHTVVVTDHVGNSTTYTVTIYKIYTVTFVADGETVDTVQVNHGDSIAELPQPPAKSGYTVKWDKQLGTVTDDVTVTAVYTKITPVDDPSTDTPSTDTPSTDTPSTGNPPTGSSELVLLWLAVGFVSAVLLGIARGKKKA